MLLPWLSVAMFTPLVGLVILMIFHFKEWEVKNVPSLVAFFFSVLSSAIGFSVIFRMGNSPDLQFVHQMPWIDYFSIEYFVGLDGVNVLMYALVCLMMPILIWSEMKRSSGKKGVISLYLVLQVTAQGMVLSQDIFMTFFFWSLMTLPIYLLVSIWGREKRNESSMNWFVFSSLGSGFFLMCLIMIYFGVEPHTLIFPKLIGNLLDRNEIEFFRNKISSIHFAFFLLGCSFLLKLPVSPMKGWFRFLLKESPESLSVFMVSVFVPLVLSLYFKLSYIVFGSILNEYAKGIFIFGAIQLGLSVFRLLGQRCVYSFLTELVGVFIGFTMIGVSTLDSIGVLGAHLYLFVMGLTLGLLGFVLGDFFVKAKHELLLDDEGKNKFGGIVYSAPKITFFTGFALISFVGIPGFSGFVGTSLMSMGILQAEPLMLFYLILIFSFLVFGLFQLFQKIFLGAATNLTAQWKDLGLNEVLYLVPIFFVLFFVGFFPNPFLEIIRPSLMTWVSLVN